VTTVNVNLDDVEEFEPLPKGTYLCRITNAETKDSQSGKPMVRCEAEVAEGEHEGRKLFFNTMVKSKEGKANYFLKRLIEALGVEWTKKGFSTEDMFGCEFMAIVGQHEYEGRIMNDVNDYLPPS